MYCYYLNGECITPTNCMGCDYYRKYFSFISQQYNYKCSCGGEFITPIYKWINTEVKEIGSDKIVANVGQGYYAYVCPFCGKIMEGMNG